MKVTRMYFILLLLFMMASCSQKKKTNWNVTFDKSSKEPYGCYIAAHELSEIFQNAKIELLRNPFTQINDELDNGKASLNRNHVIIIVTHRFDVDSVQFEKLQRYIKQGNSVFIAAENFNSQFFKSFHSEENSVKNTYYFLDNEDTLANQKTRIFFNHNEYEYTFNGLPLNHAFTMDTNYTDEFYYQGYHGTTDSLTSLIQYPGDGEFMICRTPLAFTNYFLLQGNNKEYYEHLLSTFNQYPTSVTWYSMYSHEAGEDDSNSLKQLFKNPPLLYAFLLILALLLIYTLFESKRRQAAIDILPSNTNSSLEFTETVGMLYFNKKDNKNLSEKMIQYYLESIRTKFALKTNELNEEFAQLLSRKTYHSLQDTNAFIAYLQYIRSTEKITEIDIKHLYNQLKKYS